MIRADQNDPETAFVNQGWWGDDPECGQNHCCRKKTSKVVGTIPFPYNWTVNMTSNNAAALLLPDGETLVQFQPLVRCSPGSPLYSLPSWHRNTYYNGTAFIPMPTDVNTSILGPGLYGAHGGSRLSSIGGTIRLGELLPSAPPINHSLKLMLWAAEYYWPGNLTIPCYRWPALNCDGSWNASTDPANTNFYNGTNPKLKPGALLAIPESISKNITLETIIGEKIKEALRDYGGYLDDNTASDAGAFNVEGGVIEEVESVYDGLNLKPIASNTPLYRDLVKIYRGLHLVDNNAAKTIGGGGIPRRATKPPICEI
eukprot:g2382.t1